MIQGCDCMDLIALTLDSIECCKAAEAHNGKLEANYAGLLVMMRRRSNDNPYSQAISETLAEQAGELEALRRVLGKLLAQVQTLHKEVDPANVDCDPVAYAAWVAGK